MVWSKKIHNFNNLVKFVLDFFLYYFCNIFEFFLGLEGGLGRSRLGEIVMMANSAWWETVINDGHWGNKGV